MPRYRMTVEYDGTPYKGWQRQKNGHSVQAAIEAAIARFAREDVTLQVAGRTDAGVHATGQVSHADLERDWPPFKFHEAVNAMLREAGEAVSVLSVEKAQEGFHARFSATRRHYLYRIVNRRPPLALDRDRAWWVKKGVIDEQAMADAAQVLIGTHDFTTFRAAQCQAKSPVKTMERIAVTRSGDCIEVRCSARSFLHNQVRSMVGSLKLVGEGRWTRDDLRHALEARDHQACGALAPPHGLYLTGVDYG
ncbi:tRNA pseudouridine(38-40) synthase TruA [Zhengella sp. ZM62]|uniref:tRNA pseudouridine(38-40) synthase TruA n=1 Tax=Zhengella sedimenti TaxID=3390035 RepID=UPI0039762D62